jgi:hypothetical protein
MENASHILTNTISDKPQDLNCVSYAMNRLQLNQTFPRKNPVCSREKLLDILSQAFDQHQKPIVNLIQKIIYYKTGHRIARNEIRRKYHFHDCVFQQEPDFFNQHYDFMYSRILGLNRHTLLLCKSSL